jgi:hypothetical protein
MVNSILKCKGFFPNVSTDISNISKDVVQYIDCPGQEGNLLK